MIDFITSQQINSANNLNLNNSSNFIFSCRTSLQRHLLDVQSTTSIAAELRERKRIFNRKGRKLS